MNTYQQVFSKLNEAHSKRFPNLKINQQVTIISALDPKPFQGAVTHFDKESITVNNGLHASSGENLSIVYAWIEIIDIK